MTAEQVERQTQAAESIAASLKIIAQCCEEWGIRPSRFDGGIRTLADSPPLEVKPAASARK